MLLRGDWKSAQTGPIDNRPAGCQPAPQSKLTHYSISSGVFRHIATRTGGKAYWAKIWQKQVEAFEFIREDLGNSYTVTYYPQPNPSEGLRKIPVEIVTDVGKKYLVRSRPGYRPRGQS